MSGTKGSWRGFVMKGCKSTGRDFGACAADALIDPELFIQAMDMAVRFAKEKNLSRMYCRLVEIAKLGQTLAVRNAEY